MWRQLAACHSQSLVASKPAPPEQLGADSWFKDASAVDEEGVRILFAKLTSIISRTRSKVKRESRRSAT